MAAPTPSFTSQELQDRFNQTLQAAEGPNRSALQEIVTETLNATDSALTAKQAKELLGTLQKKLVHFGKIERPDTGTPRPTKRDLSALSLRNDAVRAIETVKKSVEKPVPDQSETVQTRAI